MSKFAGSPHRKQRPSPAKEDQRLVSARVAPTGLPSVDASGAEKAARDSRRSEAGPSEAAGEPEIWAAALTSDRDSPLCYCPERTDPIHGQLNASC